MKKKRKQRFDWRSKANLFQEMSFFQGTSAWPSGAKFLVAASDAVYQLKFFHFAFFYNEIFRKNCCNYWLIQRKFFGPIQRKFARLIFCVQPGYFALILQWAGRGPFDTACSVTLAGTCSALPGLRPRPAETVGWSTRTYPSMMQISGFEGPSPMLQNGAAKSCPTPCVV